MRGRLRTRSAQEANGSAPPFGGSFSQPFSRVEEPRDKRNHFRRPLLIQASALRVVGCRVSLGELSTATFAQVGNP